MSDVEFLEAKIEFFAAAIPEKSQRDGFTQMWSLPLEELRSAKGSLTTRAIKFDQNVEWCVRSFFPQKQADEIRTNIRTKFGFDALSKNPTAVIPRVLKRGRILTDAEAEIVRSFVAHQSNERAKDKKTMDRLAELLDEAGY